ncbi:unnamed protein product [Symbiodinium natans]|uniref:Uncharacterized protein n=1 Tax=Symbiodinium natans TaxID=878477 RepID=A0A812KZS7_9DINO|nr:unnamed protein product [Symbiodinium natans]
MQHTRGQTRALHAKDCHGQCHRPPATVAAVPTAAPQHAKHRRRPVGTPTKDAKASPPAQLETVTPLRLPRKLGSPTRHGSRAWKLCVLAPRMLLSRAAAFRRGEWARLLAAVRRSNPPRSQRGGDDAEVVAERKREQTCAKGELSRARHLVSAAELAPGNEATWRLLTDPARRLPRPRTAVRLTWLNAGRTVSSGSARLLSRLHCGMRSEAERQG